MIVFATLAGDSEGAAFTVAGIVLIILALDWVAMLFAEPILRRIGTVLQVFAVVLGVTQIALGLQVILQSLCMIGVLAGCRSQASVMQIRHLHPRFDAIITQGCANEVRQQACTFCDNAKGRILRSSGCDGIVEGARACSD